MGELPDRIRRGVAAVEALSPADESAAVYEVTTTPFDARVRVESDDGTATFTVTVEVPTLSAATHDEVADVVEDGWLDTFRRRMADVDMALSGATEGDPAVRADAETVYVEASLSDIDAERGAADARAFAEYVEGTYMEGVVPGYDYRDPVASLRQQARERGQAPPGDS